AMVALVAGMAGGLGKLAWADQPAGDEPIRIGVIATWSGPYADYGRQFDAGMALYLNEHGQKLGGRTVNLIRRDTAGAAPTMAKRHAQELIVKDKVNF